jgi:hypothetical protein
MTSLLYSLTPPAGGESFLLWAIGILLAGALGVWRLYVAQLAKIEVMYLKQIETEREITKERLAEKDARISILENELKQIISEIKPSLDAANDIAEDFLKTLRNGQ